MKNMLKQIKKVICKIDGHVNRVSLAERVNTTKGGIVAIFEFNGYCSRCGKKGLAKTL